MARIALLYTWDWTQEIAAHAQRTVPSHRLFGYEGLRKLGHRVTAFARPNRMSKLIKHAAVWKAYQSLALALNQRHFDVAVSHTNRWRCRF